MKRRGFIAVWLMLALVGLVTIMAVVLYTAVHSVRMGASMENGLIAQYAAESGAVWGLENVKANGWKTFDGDLPLVDGSRCRVRITEETGGIGRIQTRGTSPAGTVRYIQLTLKVEEGDPRRVEVQEMEYGKWN